MNDENKGTEVICTCDPEKFPFVTTPCPEHGTKPPSREFGKNIPLVITDENIANKDQPWGIYEGFIFICPNCKNSSIMVNKDMGGFCLSCRIDVEVKSKIVTEYVRNLI